MQKQRCLLTIKMPYLQGMLFNSRHLLPSSAPTSRRSCGIASEGSYAVGRDLKLPLGQGVGKIDNMHNPNDT